MMHFREEEKGWTISILKNSIDDLSGYSPAKNIAWETLLLLLCQLQILKHIEKLEVNNSYMGPATFMECNLKVCLLRL